MLEVFEVELKPNTKAAFKEALNSTKCVLSFCDFNFRNQNKIRVSTKCNTQEFVKLCQKLDVKSVKIMDNEYKLIEVYHAN